MGLFSLQHFQFKGELLLLVFYLVKFLPQLLYFAHFGTLDFLELLLESFHFVLVVTPGRLLLPNLELFRVNALYLLATLQLQLLLPLLLPQRLQQSLELLLLGLDTSVCCGECLLEGLDYCIILLKLPLLSFNILALHIEKVFSLLLEGEARRCWRFRSFCARHHYEGVLEESFHLPTHLDNNFTPYHKNPGSEREKCENNSQ